MACSEKFVIHGGRPLSGEFEVFGSKNAALPILAATLLTKEPCTIENVPRIKDIERMLAMIESLGAKVTWIGPRAVEIEAQELRIDGFAKDLASKLRASVLLLGPLLFRFGEIELPYPGGDQIGTRSIDTHLEAFQSLGIQVEEGPASVRLKRNAVEPTTANVVLKEFSVTATENVLLFCAGLPFPVRIFCAACEPHVAELALFLKKLGAKVRGEGTHEVVIAGASALRGAHHTLSPDPIEAGTMIAAAAATRGKLRIYPVVEDHLRSVLEKFRKFGVSVTCTDGAILDVEARGKLTATKAQILPYPGIPSDLQAIFGTIATQSDGVTHIHDPLYEGRFRYLDELIRMGAKATLANPHEAYITGPSKLFGVDIPALDIRSGAALVIAGLVAEGETVLHDAHLIDRGYERFEERLRDLGAEIQRITA